jgi:uncharacterized membrane protein
VSGRFFATCTTVLCITAILLGFFFRFNGLGARTPFEDEAMTWLRTSGYTQAALNRYLYDGLTHTAGEISLFQTHNSRHGIGMTVAVLAADDPQHAPLFFVLEHLWSDIFGDTLQARRMLSVLAGLAFIASFAWLCRVLFDNSGRVALIGASLAAVAPLHIAYAQQAREYELWAAMLCLWSVACITAARDGTIHCSVGYALATITALYTSVLSLPVLVAHALWISLGTEYKTRRAPFFFASAGALFAYIPWLLTMVLHRQKAVAENAWSSGAWPWLPFVEKWAFNLSATFFDLMYVDMRYAPLGAAVLFFTLFACMKLPRCTSPGTARFIFLFAGVSTATFLLPDILFREHRSTEARYVLPLFIALECTVAGILAERRSTPFLRLGSFVVLSVFLTLGVWAGFVRTTHSSWWENNKDSALPAIAETLNTHVNNGLLAEDGTTVLALSNILDPRIPIHMADTRTDIWIRSIHQGMYVLTPSETLHAMLEKHGFHLKPIVTSGATASLRAFRNRSADGMATLDILR